MNGGKSLNTLLTTLMGRWGVATQRLRPWHDDGSSSRLRYTKWWRCEFFRIWHWSWRLSQFRLVRNI